MATTASVQPAPALPAGGLRLTDGSLLYRYDLFDSDDGPGYAYLAHRSADGTQIDTPVYIGVDGFFGDNTSVSAVALPGGRFAALYVSRTADFEETHMVVGLVTGGPNGFDPPATVADFYNDFGVPVPVEVTTDPVLTVQANGTLLVTYSSHYTPTNPDYPDYPQPESGSQQYSRLYDGSGHLLSTRFVDFDGSVTADSYNPATGALASEVYVHAGLTQTTVLGITGHDYVKQVTVADASHHVVSATRFDAGGNLVFSSTEQADGSYRTRSFNAAGEQDMHTDAAGGLIDGQSFDASGHLVGDIAVSGGQRVSRTLDPLSGSPTLVSTRNADGSHVNQQFVTGRPYAEQDVAYDSANRLVEVVRKYADGHLFSTNDFASNGSEQVNNYDTLARETTSLAIAPDGSRDVTTRHYVGTATIPDMITTIHYDASGHVTPSTAALAPHMAAVSMVG